MKAYHFRRVFSLFRQRFHFHAQSLKLPLGLSLSTFFWTYYSLSFSKPALQVSQGDITFLSKEAYYDKILGNEKDFFFLVVYTDNEEGNLHVNKVARRLKHLAQENGLEDWNVYVLSRPIFEDIKKTIGRTGNVQLFAGSNEIMPVELYMKTPHSRDFMFLKHKPNKFFTAEGLEKISHIMNKASHLVHTVSTEESLRVALGESLNKFSRPTIILRINDTNKITYKKVAKKFAKLAFLSLERKYLPFDAQFIILKGANVGKNLNLEYDCPYIFRNDAIEAYERYSGETINNDNEYIVVDKIGGCEQKVKLEKFDNKEVKVFGRIKPKKEAEEDKRRIKQKEIESFMNFLLPRVVILKDLKYRELGQLMKRCTKERRKQGENQEDVDYDEGSGDRRLMNYKRYQERYGKYVLSLFCPSTDPQRNEKLKVFMDLYRIYKDMFVFCIIESEVSQDFFPHSTSAYPCLTLFNFLNQRKYYEYFSEKNKILVYPYEKYFLNQKSPYQPNEEEVIDSIETIIQSKPQLNYLNTLNDNVQELKGGMVDETLNELKKKGEDGMFLLYDESLESLNVNRMVNKLSEELHGVKIYRMEGPNSSKDLPLRYKQFPQLVYFATRKKKVYVIEQDLMKNSKELKEFLQGIRG